MDDDPPVLIDYPWEDFLRDFHTCADLPEKSLDTVSKAIPSCSPSEAHNRSLVLAKVFAYIEDNIEKLNQGKTAVVGRENILLGHHVLQTLHHFLVRTHPRDWEFAPRIDDRELHDVPTDQGAVRLFPPKSE